MKKRLLLRIAMIIGIVLLVASIIYFPFFHHQDVNEVGLARNFFTGETYAITESGYHRNYPWVWVAIVDTRPHRVCITTTARSYHCKLVQFKAEHYQEFLDVEGWRYYWWSNFFSINFGYSEEYRGFNDVLRGYAFGSKQYPFVVVTGEN